MGYSRNKDETPIHRCVACGYLFDTATRLGDFSEAIPNPGDISICVKCGHMAIFGEDVKLREMTTGEICELSGSTSYPIVLQSVLSTRLKKVMENRDRN